MKSIKGYVKIVAQKLKCQTGYFKRQIELKRLEKYSNEIDMVLTKYNKKSCNETMMVKGLRKSNEETTNRKIHQEDLEKIVAELSKGLGYFCHNTLGARELIYTDKVYDEIIEKIKVHNPNVSQKTLDKIRKSLWLIMDGINAHNGEKPEKEYIPEITKTEEDFTEEMIQCYVKKGMTEK